MFPMKSPPLPSKKPNLGREVKQTRISAGNEKLWNGGKPIKLPPANHSHISDLKKKRNYKVNQNSIKKPPKSFPAKMHRPVINKTPKEDNKIHIYAKKPPRVPPKNSKPSMKKLVVHHKKKEGKKNEVNIILPKPKETNKQRIQFLENLEKKRESRNHPKLMAEPHVKVNKKRKKKTTKEEDKQRIELLEKRLEHYKSENFKLKSQTLQLMQSQIERELLALQPKHVEKDIHQIEKSGKLLTEIKLDRELGKSRLLESNCKRMLNLVNQHIDTLEDQKSFEVYDLYKLVVESRLEYLQNFKKKKKNLTHYLNWSKLTIEAIESNNSIGETVGRASIRIDEMSKIVGMLEKKMKNKKFLLDHSINQIDREMKDFDRFNESFLKLKGEITKKLKDQDKRYETLRKKFGDIYNKSAGKKKVKDQKEQFFEYKDNLIELMTKYKIIEVFMENFRRLYDVLANFIHIEKIKQIRSMVTKIYDERKERDEYHEKIEEDFKNVNLRNDKNLEKYTNLDTSIKNKLEDLLTHRLSAHVLQLIECVTEIKKIVLLSSQKSLLEFRERMVVEMKDIEKELNKYNKDLVEVYKELEIVWGKIYEKDTYSGILQFIKKRKLIYFGMMKDNQRHGIGKEFHEDQKTVKWYGKFLNNKRNGQGKEFDEKGEPINSERISQTPMTSLKTYQLPKLMELIDPIKDLLGKGSFGEVYKIKIENQIYALKRLFLAKKDHVQIDRVKNEVKILATLKHPNVIKIFGWGEYEADNSIQFGIITEFCPGKVDFSQKMKFSEKVSILIQICEGMIFLHEHDIIHRDLKFENVLLGDDKKVRIIDFGLAKQIESYRLTYKGTTSPTGTQGFIAPELLKGERHTNKCDVFSFAIMMYQLFFSTNDPYKTKEHKDPFYCFKLPEEIMNGLRPEIPKKYLHSSYKHGWFVRLMQRCWAEKPFDRPNFLTIISTIKGSM